MARAADNGVARSASMMKRANTASLLNYLRLAGETSRADLARASGLDPKTITNLANELIARRMVISGKPVVAGRGRPAEKLSIHPDAGCAIGLDLGVQQITGVVLDLRGSVRHHWREEYGVPRSRAFLLEKAGRCISELRRSMSPSLRRSLEGIGVCVPGFIDRTAGVVLESVNIRGFTNVPLVATFEQRFELPVLLEEASRAKALAELWFGRHGPVDHLICLDIGFGIGMGIIHQGVLYRGTNECSGEIGHTIVEFNGRVCRCGKRGCLETVASGRALDEMAREIVGDAGAKKSGARAIYDAAVAGDARARQVLRRTGEYLGIAIANVANLLDPDLVVLSGGLVDAGAMLVDPLQQAVAANGIGSRPSSVRVAVSTLGPLSGAMGAATNVLRHHFEISDGSALHSAALPTAVG